MSDRSELADRLAEVIIAKRMTAPFGGDVTKGKKSYDILFAKPRTLDGLVQVYSPKFILIMCQGRAAPGYEWREVYENEADAVAFLNAVGDSETDKAMLVPHRRRI
jgi:hypothetical protein